MHVTAVPSDVPPVCRRRSRAVHVRVGRMGCGRRQRRPQSLHGRAALGDSVPDRGAASVQSFESTIAKRCCGTLERAHLAEVLVYEAATNAATTSCPVGTMVNQSTGLSRTEFTPMTIAAPVE